MKKLISVIVRLVGIILFGFVVTSVIYALALNYIHVTVWDVVAQIVLFILSILLMLNYGGKK